MRFLRYLIVLVAFSTIGFSATLGTVVALVGGASDLVLDEGRGRLYLVNTSQNRVEVYSIPQRRFLAPIRTEATPLAAAMSRSAKFLYVTSFDGSALDVIDLDTLNVTNRVSLPVKPEGVAVGADDQVLISTIGSGAGSNQNVLLIYNPNATDSNSLQSVLIAPPAPTNPVLPAPSGRIFLASHGQLLASPDGNFIIGVNLPNNAQRAVFVYEVASGTVLRSRLLANLSSVLSVSPDGSKFMSGLNLFDTQTLEVLAQENIANAPYPIAPGTNFNVQTNQGGSVFSPDGSALYAAFDITPFQNPPARPNVSQLMINDPDNLMINMGVQLPENLAGKMVMTADGGTIYALSESGFVIIPIGQLTQNPIAQPDSSLILLANDQCGVTAGSRSASVQVKNMGKGRMTANAQLLQFPTTGPNGLGGFGGPGGGQVGGGIIIILPPGVGGVTTPGPTLPGGGGQQNATIANTSPVVRTTNNATGTQLDFTFTGSAAARVPGTVSPTHTFLIQSNEAVNIPTAVRVDQNFRDSDAKADLIPIPVGLSSNEALVDMVADNVRQRLYIANSGLNRVEVFDMRKKQLLAPIKVGQLPRSLAIAPDGNFMYVANSGGENISIVDLDKQQVVDRVHFPPLPFNFNSPLVTPSIIAAGIREPMVIMNNGTLWKIVGNQAVPRNVSPIVGTATLPAPRTMASTPNGEYIMVLAGNGFVYLYDSLADDFVQGRQVFNNPIQGYYGPIAAGPRGQYFLANGTILNQALTPVGNAGTVNAGGATRPGVAPATLSRPVSAVAAASSSTFVRFSQPALANANTPLSATDTSIVELVDVNTGQTMRQASLLEGPLSMATGTQRVNVDGRTMAVDASGSTAYALTTTGLSITTLDAPNLADRPIPSQNGIVNLASYLPQIAQGGLISIFGRNLGNAESASTATLPTVLGATCVTMDNQPLPLFSVSAGQINAAIPQETTAGRHSLVVRALDKKAASAQQAITIVKYAPGIFTDPTTKEAMIFRQDGSRVDKDHPANRDEHLMMFAAGLGPTKGGKATGGNPAPSNPLAVTDPVNLYFGDPRIKEAGIIVDWSGLVPGLVGVYQINFRVPGAHISGDALPVMLKIGGVDSQSTGPVVPVVPVN